MTKVSTHSRIIQLISVSFNFFFFGVCAAMKTTGCNLDKVNMLPNALITPLISSTMIKSEDITPMEVTAEKRSPSIFKVSYSDQ